MNIAFRASLEATLHSREPAGAPALARIAVYRDLADSEATWRRLIALGAVASPYQSFDWVRLWHRHVSGPQGMQPCIVAGFDPAGDPLFLWPFVRERLGPFTAAGFFGGKHATINMALWRQDAGLHFTRAEMQDVLTQLTAIAPDLDFILLSNQPHEWHGTPNPFAQLAHHRATEENFVLRLGGSGSAVVERELSNSMRSRLRNKERKLQKLPGYRYLRAQTPEQVSFQLDSFFAQKTRKLTALGLHDVFSDPGVQDFIRAACHEGLERGEPVIALHALEGGGEMLALFSGIHDGSRFTSMFNSHTDSDNARHSPGLILLQHLVADCADRGFQSFDIGPGEARYKSFFCKELEPIFNSVLAVSARAKAVSVPLRLLFQAKSAIKHNPALWAVASSVRRAVNRVKGQ